LIAISIIAVFVALLIVLVMVMPGQKVSKQRLGIERQPRNLGKSIEGLMGAARQRKLARALSLADVNVEPGQFVLRVVVTSVLLGILGLVINPMLGLVLVVLPCVVVHSWVSHKVNKRQSSFAEQLPNFLRSLVMSLRSGFGLSQAMESAAQEAPEPLRGEIERVLAEVRIGRSLPEAMGSLSQRMNNEDLEWVVGAIEINRETGGNLSDILESVNTTLRERARIQRKINTFTAEGRFSAKILTAAPFLFGLWQWRAHPDGFEALFSGPGLLVVGGCLALMVVGWFWIRRVITIKI
jgi:tight adherence protein B